MPKLMRMHMRVGRLMLLAGAGMLALGGILALVWPGVIANFLLVWSGPQITIVGVLGYGYARSEVAKHHRS